MKGRESLRDTNRMKSHSKEELQAAYNNMTEKEQEVLNETAELLEVEPWQAVAVGVFVYRQSIAQNKIEARSYIPAQLEMNEQPRFSLVH